MPIPGVAGLTTLAAQQATSPETYALGPLAGEGGAGIEALLGSGLGGRLANAATQGALWNAGSSAIQGGGPGDIALAGAAGGLLGGGLGAVGAAAGPALSQSLRLLDALAPPEFAAASTGLPRSLQDIQADIANAQRQYGYQSSTASGDASRAGNMAGDQARTRASQQASQTLSRLSDLQDELTAAKQGLPYTAPPTATGGGPGAGAGAGGGPTPPGGGGGGTSPGAPPPPPPPVPPATTAATAQASAPRTGLWDLIHAERIGSLAGGIPTLAHIALNTPTQLVLKLASDAPAAIASGHPEAVLGQMYGVVQGIRSWALSQSLTAAAGAPSGLSLTTAPGRLAEGLIAQGMPDIGAQGIEAGLLGAVKLHPALQNLAAQIGEHMDLWGNAFARCHRRRLHAFLAAVAGAGAAPGQ